MGYCLNDMQTATNLLARPLAIGGTVLRNRVFLAPMSGISDAPFRDIASSFGAGMVVSEMIAGEMLARGDGEASARAEPAGRGPHVIQLAGREARWMAEGARAATDAGADIVDINMGCPAKKVTGGYSGSALMRDLDHAVRLIDATVAATAKPVTLKMRLGWDAGSVNAAELARRAEAAGVKMITVHGRTRCQFYSASADWGAIRAVKESVSIPLIANGDLTSARDLARMLELSGADGVMIGRGAYGRPWLPGHLALFASTGTMPAEPSGEALLALVVEHYEAMLAHCGERVGVKVARKHLGWYLERAGASVSLRQKALTAVDPGAVIDVLQAALGEDVRRAA
jgi:tRNA-dihydrouridine synthase B